MAVIEPRFVYGVVRKSLLLGAIAAAITFLAVSVEFAAAVVIGTLVSAINLRTVAWAIRKMLDAGRDGGTSSVGWSLLLAGKMLLLIGVIWLLIAHVNVDAVGFVFGFSLFMPAIGLEMLLAPSVPDDDRSEE